MSKIGHHLSKLAALITFSWISTCWGAPMPENHVLDEAHLLSPAQTQVLGQILMEQEQLTTDRIAVAILSTRAPSPDLESKAAAIFDDWSMNSREHQSGVLILLAWKEREARIQLNARVHSILSDSQVDELIQGRLVNRLESRSPATGILETTSAILEALDSPLISSGRLQTILQGLPADEKKTVVHELASSRAQTLPVDTYFGSALAVMVLGFGFAFLVLFRVQHRDAHFTQEGWFSSTWIEDLRTDFSRMNRPKNRSDGTPATSDSSLLGGVDGSW